MRFGRKAHQDGLSAEDHNEPVFRPLGRTSCFLVEAVGAIPAPDENRVVVGGEENWGRDGGDNRGAESGKDVGVLDEGGCEMVAELAESEDDDERQTVGEQEAREFEAQLHLHYTRRVLGPNEHILNLLATEIERKTDAYKQKRREMLVTKDISRNSITFHEQRVVTLKILAKIRLKVEQSRIALRIFEILPSSGRYKLICQWGFLCDNFAHGDLNAAGKWNKLEFASTGEGLSIGMPWTDELGRITGPPDDLDHLSVSKAVQKMNGDRLPVSAY